MPAQKQSLPESFNDDDHEESLAPEQCFRTESRQGLEAQEEQEKEAEEVKKEEKEDANGEEEEDSQEIENSNCSEENSEFVYVELQAVRNIVQCPICLRILRKTRTVMDCMHRYCRECIDKSMRMGNKGCPACRTHCATRRSLRDDKRYDALIAALYDDMDKYEEEELAFREEDKARNQQIQESIAEIIQRQEALARRRTLGKESAGADIPSSRKNCRNAPQKRKRKGNKHQASDDSEEEDENEGSKGSSSSGELLKEVKPKRKYKKRAEIRPSELFQSAANKNGLCSENELNRESRISIGLGWKPEILGWGKGGARSQTRHGSVNGSSSKSARSTHLSKVADYLQSFEENDDELNVPLMLVCLDAQNKELQHPFLSCRPSLSVKHLCEYVAVQTCLEIEEVEILVAKRNSNTNADQPTHRPTSMDDSNPMPTAIDSGRDDLQVLEGQEDRDDLHVLERQEDRDDLQVLKGQEDRDDLQVLEGQEDRDDLQVLERQEDRDDLQVLKGQEDRDDLQVLEGQVTLGDLKADCRIFRDYMILGYRRRDTN